MGEGKPIIAGAAGVRYTPIDLSKAANQFRNERGWFGDPATTFKDLPIGRQTFAEVPFDVFEFPTSPVPTAVMLGGPGVPGGLPEQVEIPVGRTAAALFFLQTARLDVRRSDQDRREGRRFRMAEYVVAYADGSSETIPLYAEEDLDDFRQAKPASLPGAALAWSKPYEGRGVSATAWVKQWSNPHPDRPIRSVTLRYGPDRRGVPVLLALTAAS
jgi:beta-galactosidase